MVFHCDWSSESGSSDVPAADAAKKDPEQFDIWRNDPANFSFDGRYPLLEVYDKAKQAWKGVAECYCCFAWQCTVLNLHAHIVFVFYSCS